MNLSLCTDIHTPYDRFVREFNFCEQTYTLMMACLYVSSILCTDIHTPYDRFVREFNFVYRHTHSL